MNQKKGLGFDGIDPTLINGISGEILSLQSLSDKQRILENKLTQQKIRVNILLFIGIALLTQLVIPLAKWALPHSGVSI